MKRTERRQVVELVRTPIGDVDDVVGINPSCLVASFAIFMDVGALALISSDDGMLRRGRNGFSFRE